MKFVDTIEAAVTGIMFIQESVPENPDLKGTVLEEIDNYAPENALICSSFRNKTIFVARRHEEPATLHGRSSFQSCLPSASC